MTRRLQNDPRVAQETAYRVLLAEGSTGQR
jgi:hypothetical protein